MYEIDDVTLEIISSLQRLFKNKAEEYEQAANVCHELVNLSTLLKRSALKLVLQNTVSTPIQLSCTAEVLQKPEDKSEEETPQMEEEK